MHFLTILNRDGGTLRTMDLDAFSALVTARLEAAGHKVEIDIVSGQEMDAALARAAAHPSADVLMVGGGDGSVSAAAAALMEKRMALAILPAGTMNLFARSLGVPLALEAAVDTYKSGRLHRVDVASADGKPFVHQFSLGMHAKLVHLRENMSFRSRVGKIFASMKAGVTTFLDPPRMKIALAMGGTEVLVNTSSLGVTNNLFGEGHALPYADMPDAGVLGIYVTRAKTRRDLAWFVVNMALGRWRRNDQVVIHETDAVTIKILAADRRFGCAVDGELMPLSRETRIEIHPGVLQVLIPAA